MATQRRIMISIIFVCMISFVGVVFADGGTPTPPTPTPTPPPAPATNPAPGPSTTPPPGPATPPPGGPPTLNITISFESKQATDEDFFKNKFTEDILVQFTYCTAIDFTYVPCATSKIVDGKLKCAMGDDQCNLEKVLACASDKYKGEDQFNLATFIMCMLSATEALNDAGTKCTQGSTLKWDDINTCAQGNDAAQKCDTFHQFYQNLQPTPQTTPVVVFDQKYTEADSSAAKQNFKDTVCKKVKEKKIQCDCCA